MIKNVVIKLNIIGNYNAIVQIPASKRSLTYSRPHPTHRQIPEGLESPKHS